MRTGLVIEEGGSLGPLVFELLPTKEGAEPTVELFGVGAMLGPDGDVLVVQQIIPGGGAELAGLVPGDAVLRIDGVPVAALGMDDSIQRIRGPEGSLVRLAVRRRADGSIADVPVKRLRVTF
jgi:C-terminal processing protease CtpA/Prc